MRRPPVPTRGTARRLQRNPVAGRALRAVFTKHTAPALRRDRLAAYHAVPTPRCPTTNRVRYPRVHYWLWDWGDRRSAPPTDPRRIRVEWPRRAVLRSGLRRHVDRVDRQQDRAGRGQRDEHRLVPGYRWGAAVRNRRPVACRRASPRAAPGAPDAGPGGRPGSSATACRASAAPEDPGFVPPDAIVRGDAGADRGDAVVPGRPRTAALAENGLAGKQRAMARQEGGIWRQGAARQRDERAASTTRRIAATTRSGSSRWME